MTVKELIEALSMLPDDLRIGLNIFVPNGQGFECFSETITGVIIDEKHNVYINSNNGETRP